MGYPFNMGQKIDLDNVGFYEASRVQIKSNPNILGTVCARFYVKTVRMYVVETDQGFLQILSDKDLEPIVRLDYQI